MRYLFTLTTVLLVAFTLQAQGTINVEAQPKVEEMLQRWTEINKSKQFIDGYRIQLVATTDRQKVESEKKKFEGLYPGVFVDWTHVAPYYRLRAGAYSTKLEAAQMLYKLKRYYKAAYAVKDNRIQPFEVLN